MPLLSDDLDWQAFLYVSDELDDREQAAFEARLDQDQVAREAVARAVALVQVLAAVPTTPAPVLSLPSRHRRLWIAAAAAAVLVAVIPALRALRPSIDPAPMAEVALAWSDLREAQNAGSTEADLFGGTESVDAGLAEESPSAPPSWLLMAAAPGGEPTDPLDQQRKD